MYVRLLGTNARVNDKLVRVPHMHRDVHQDTGANLVGRGDNRRSREVRQQRTALIERRASMHARERPPRKRKGNSQRVVTMTS